MEQPPQYWMWETATTNHKDNKKQRSLMSTSSPRHHLYLHQPAAQPPSSSYEDSWEEQAFAEDAAGSLGGCIWPPRSYSCTFCRREFRSAQALGGHMNVHRRDRARLKRQSPASSSPSVLPYQFPSNSSPNPSPDPPPSPLPARVYADDANNCSEKSFFPSAAEEEEEEEKTPHGPTSSNSPPIGMEEGIYKRRRVINRCSNPRADSSAVSLNLVLQRSSQPTASSEEAAAVVRFKRKRLMEDNRDFPFVLMGLDSMPRRRPQEVFEMMKISNNHNIPAGASCFKEELDLELRLGDRPPPKVKSI